MPIDLVIDERESPGTTPVGSGNGGGSLKGGEGGGGVGSGLPGDSNNNANRSSNADSTSHTDGASTPDMVRTHTSSSFVKNKIKSLSSSSSYTT